LKKTLAFKGAGNAAEPVEPAWELPHISAFNLIAIERRFLQPAPWPMVQQ
jgi:hypothetical protein